MTDYEHMIVSAVRYALGRMTYIVNLTINYVLKDIEENKLGEKSLKCIHEDIYNAKSLGMEYDKKDWQRLLDRIEKELRQWS